MHISLLPTALRSCFTCTHFGGPVGHAYECNDPRFNHAVSLPERGCAYWVREPGTDDDIERTFELHRRDDHICRYMLDEYRYWLKAGKRR